MRAKSYILRKIKTCVSVCVCVYGKGENATYSASSSVAFQRNAPLDPPFLPSTRTPMVLTPAIETRSPSSIRQSWVSASEHGVESWLPFFSFFFCIFSFLGGRGGGTAKDHQTRNQEALWTQGPGRRSPGGGGRFRPTKRRLIVLSSYALKASEHTHTNRAK